MDSALWDDPASLDERIELLSAMCANPPGDTDLAALLGLLGAHYMALYERDGDADALDSALRRFHDAYASAPDHPQQPQWCSALGYCYSYRSARTDDVADYESTIEWLDRFLAGPSAADPSPAGTSDADPERDDATAVLADAYWDRFYAIRYGADCDPATALREAQYAVVAIGGLPDIDKPALAAYVRALLGLAHMELFDEAGDRADLDAGIECLAAALDSLPPEAPRYAFAGSRLVDAYQRRADLDDDPANLDVGIAVGVRVLSGCRPEDPDRVKLNVLLAVSYAARWMRAEDAADLDEAIGHWQTALDIDLDPWGAGQCGQLLHQRASLTKNVSDAVEAVRLLDLAARSAAGDPGAWFPWLALALAHHGHWQLARARESLAEAVRCLDQSLELAPSSGDGRLVVHNQRIVVAFETLEQYANQPQASALPHAYLRRCVEDAERDLDSVADASPETHRMLNRLCKYADMYAAIYQMRDVDLDRMRDLIAHGAELSIDVTADEQADDLADSARRVTPLALQMLAMYIGDRRALGAAGSLMRQLSSGGFNLTQPEAADAEYAILADLFTAIDRGGRGDYAATIELTEQALAALDDLSPSQAPERMLRPILLYLRAAARAALGLHVAAEELPAPAPDAVLTKKELDELVAGTGVELSNAFAGDDLPAIRRIAAKATALAARAQVGSATRMVAGNLAGLGELEVSRRDPTDRAAAARSATWFEELAANLSRNNPLWTPVGFRLAEALRRSGSAHNARTRQLGLAALQAHGWRVLLQSGTDHAIDSAREASADAHMVAGWCLVDRAYEDAVAALDSGRGLVLRSATASRDVAELLTGMGHDALAAEWRQSAGFGRNQLTGDPLTGRAEGVEIPDDLRLRVMRALGVDGGPGSGLPLLTPAGVEEVRRGLSTVGGDALVFLVPASSMCPGTAVVVPVSGPVDAIGLPGLHTGTGSPIHEHARWFGVRRELSVPSTVDHGTASQRLDDVCRWAWIAAVQPLLEYARRWHLRRPTRLVLVPMGSLGLVPWHAAFTDTPRGRRYAVQEAVFSYSVSARMFCAAAGRPLQQTDSALVVGDPSGDLPFAGIEAQAIHSRFYPTGSYLGRPRADGAGAGTPDEVLDWIAAASGSSTLHFACHGHVDTSRPADAHLALAGGPLAARRLLEVSRLSALVIERVFLAACTTSITGTHYDEAFSLATAFLAAGAHTVFGSLWPVPDEDTSVLMYLVHHNINVESCAPADALHRAQLSMLEPQRRPPASMPPDLQRSFSRVQSAHPMAWAAFTHLGR